jgi:hypothetical protein
MKPLYTSVLAILATVTIAGMLTISTQQVFASRECEGCTEFKKLTNEFKKDVLKLIEDPDILPQPHLVQQFIKLTEEFKNDIINAVLNNELSRIPGMVSQYSNSAQQTVSPVNEGFGPLVISYTEEVLRIFCITCI